MLPEKIRALRKRAGLSQEQLAEKLNVSRQAVTKWESGAGIPDIDNLRAISGLFRISLDGLMGLQPPDAPEREFLFESVTEYDIDGLKRYDVALTGAKRVALTAYDGEKIRVRLASDQIPELESSFKVRLDDEKRRLDVELRRFGQTTEAAAREALYVEIRFPQRYLKAIELSANAGTLALHSITAETIAFSGKAARVEMDGVSGRVALDSNENMEILCAGLDGRLEINQLSAASRLSLPEGARFFALTRGLSNRIYYQSNGLTTEDFSLPEDAAEDCQNVIELNGMKSELIINAITGLASAR